MKHDDIRVLRRQARTLGIKYATSYQKSDLVRMIDSRQSKIADEFNAIFSPATEEDVVVIPVKVPRNRPYTLKIEHHD